LEKWLQLAEIVYKLGLPIAGAVALYLAYLRVSAANRQAEAQILQAQSSIRQIDLGRWKQAIDFFVQSAGQPRDENSKFDWRRSTLCGSCSTSLKNIVVW
jgi:hypothetical protein